VRALLKAVCAFASSFINRASNPSPKAAAQNNSGVDQPWIIAQRHQSPLRSDAIMFSQRTNKPAISDFGDLRRDPRQGLESIAWCKGLV